MLQTETYGKIVILNGTPRSGKSSIAVVIQNTFEGIWMNMVVDRFMQMTPERYQPGIGYPAEPSMKNYQAAFTNVPMLRR